jgi:hypothetical protein
MFTHSTWRQRLYYEAPGAEANETLEIYVRADGSSWLSVRTARPALSPLIRWRPLDSQRTELAKGLNQIRIGRCEVELPSQLAAKLEHLWKIMLPGVDSAPVPTVFPVHSPTFIAFAQENNSVKTGTVAIAAHGTEAHKLFVSIVGDLKKMCDGHSRGSVSKSLPRKVEQLTARLVR